MGVECYFWTHRIWSTRIDNFRYSTIPQESNGECSNIHWGWKGNKQFYEYLRLRVKDKKYFSPSEFYGLKKICLFMQRILKRIEENDEQMRNMQHQDKEIKNAIDLVIAGNFDVNA